MTSFDDHIETVDNRTFEKGRVWMVLVLAILAWMPAMAIFALLA